jgi:hypothetical protein
MPAEIGIKRLLETLKCCTLPKGSAAQLTVITFVDTSIA